MSFFEKIWELQSHQFATILNGVFHKPNNPIHYYWMLCFVGVGILYFIFARGSFSAKLDLVKSHLRKPRVYQEFKKDFFFWLLRFVYKPVLFGVLALNAKEIERSVFAWAASWNFGFAEPVVHLDPLLGSLVVGGLIFIVRDFIAYVAHALQHRLKFLWYFHMTHHFATELNPLTKFRLHPVEYAYLVFFQVFLEGLAGVFIFKAFLVHGDGYAFSVILALNYALHYSLIHFRHSPIPLRYGVLERLLLSPAAHLVHHSREKKHVNKNIGVIFSVWDQMFGTFHRPDRDEKFEFGIRGYERLILKKSLWFELKFPFILMARDLRNLLSPRSGRRNERPARAPEAVGLRREGPHRASGFTLTEVLMAILIFSLIAMAGSSIVYQFVGFNKNQSQINEVESDLNLLVGYLEQITNLAVNVRYYNGDLNGSTGSPSGEGFVRSFNYTQDSTMGSKRSETLMFFARETTMSRVSPGNLVSRFRPTGLFFVRKVENPGNGGQRTSGKLVLDLGGADAAGVVRPDGVNDLEFKNVSDVVLDQPQFAKSQVLLSMRMKVVMIYPLLSAKGGRDCFGPTRDIAANRICTGSDIRPYKTIERTFTLTFPNNKRDTFFSGAEFENGLYMFAPFRLSR